MATSVHDPERIATEKAPRRLRPGTWLDLAAVAAAAALVLAAALVGWHLKHQGVRIFLFFPPLLAWWDTHAGPGTVPAIAIAVLVVAWGPRLAARMRWRRLTWLAYATSVGWTFFLALVDGWHHGFAGRLEQGPQYLPDVEKVSSLPAMLQNFTGHILGGEGFKWTIHAGAHPPGTLGIYVLLGEAGLGGGAIASAFTVLVAASAAVAVAVTLRALGREELARAVLPFAVLFPGAVWAGVSADGMFAGVLAWGVALLAIACCGGGLPESRWPRAPVALAGGLLLGLVPYLSYGLALAVVFPLAVIAVTRAWRPTLVAVIGAALVAAGFTAGGFWWFEGYHLVTIDYAQSVAKTRPYRYFAWANLAALAFALGPAVAAGLRRFFARPARLGLAGALLTAAAVVAIVAADISGKSKGEVARIWLPFAVWLTVPTALLPRNSARFWLAAQALLALLVGHLLRTPW